MKRRKVHKRTRELFYSDDYNGATKPKFSLKRGFNGPLVDSQDHLDSFGSGGKKPPPPHSFVGPAKKAATTPAMPEIVINPYSIEIGNPIPSINALSINAEKNAHVRFKDDNQDGN